MGCIHIHICLNPVKGTALGSQRLSLLPAQRLKNCHRAKVSPGCSLLVLQTGHRAPPPRREGCKLRTRGPQGPASDVGKAPQTAAPKTRPKSSQRAPLGAAGCTGGGDTAAGLHPAPRPPDRSLEPRLLPAPGGNDASEVARKPRNQVNAEGHRKKPAGLSSSLVTLSWLYFDKSPEVKATAYRLQAMEKRGAEAVNHSQPLPG